MIVGEDHVVDENEINSMVIARSMDLWVPIDLHECFKRVYDCINSRIQASQTQKSRKKH
jgi:hypothetical protein